MLWRWIRFRVVHALAAGNTLVAEYALKIEYVILRLSKPLKAFIMFEYGMLP